ncbi:Uncharacterised protein [Acinetobacter baumannii]|nr:Uncharacterised protein [Acinetobacter baumannii]
MCRLMIHRFTFDMTSWILIWHVYIRCKEGICQRLEKSVL